MSIEKQMAEDNKILEIVTGSHLYGTNTKKSDKDYVGIFMPDKEFAFHRVPRRQTDTYQEKMFDYILTGNTLLDRAYNIIRKI
jgi:predicted nucleotidyltransferase